jgi:DNA-binding CsgD family transcriptional regulator
METDKRIATLTEREKICLRQWLEHKTAKQIAADLNISHHAVEKRLKIARIKLGTTTSRHAALILREAERSDQTVPCPPDLQGSHPTAHPASGWKIIVGGIGMALLAVALFTLALPQPSDVETTHSAVAGELIGEYDAQLDEALRSLIASAEIGPDGDVRLLPPQSDSRFLEPYSGHYWQISSEGKSDFKSRSLWDRKLSLRKHPAPTPIHYDSHQFSNEPLRVVEQTVLLSNSQTRWHFAVARSLGKQK